VTIVRLLSLVGFGFDDASGVAASVDVTAGADATVGDDVVDVVATDSFLATTIARAFSCSNLAIACMTFAFARVVRTMT